MLVSVQVVGALLVLMPFAAHQFGKLDADAPWYLRPNLIGSAAPPCSHPSADSGASCYWKQPGQRWRHGASSVRPCRRIGKANRLAAEGRRTTRVARAR
jgi:hypothetical protein